jgi:putative DNA primase/helicase
MHPVVETVPAADGRKTMIAKLREFGVDSMLDRIAEIAIFQRFNVKRGAWIDVDPPRQVAATLLSREGRWVVPRVTGVITTPTPRPDGSVLHKGGYDTTTQLYHLPSLNLPELPDRPSREQALAALALLTDLLAEFSFVGPLDRAVALAGILTVLVRGSLQTAPMYIVRAHTPGTGKSYLVDVIAAIATGRLCPVITASKSEEETEKRLGAGKHGFCSH